MNTEATKQFKIMDAITNTAIAARDKNPALSWHEAFGIAWMRVALDNYKNMTDEERLESRDEAYDIAQDFTADDLQAAQFDADMAGLDSE